MKRSGGASNIDLGSLGHLENGIWDGRNQVLSFCVVRILVSTTSIKGKQVNLNKTKGEGFLCIPSTYTAQP
jgi:hypothetical protein